MIKNKEIAVKWFAAFNEHHLDKLLELYDEQAEHYSPKLKLRNPETKGKIKGKSNLRIWWQEAFDRLPGLQYKILNIVADAQFVFMEYTRCVPGEDNYDVCEVLQIKNSLIISSKVYHA
jgi:limonene-1,2-epoxide hydrolase